MIPKPLDEIEWADLEALRESGREEGDTIEYKSSFSGGNDFLAFNDSQRDRAVKGVAREVIAFLNGRGGDVIVGAQEAGNENPRIEKFASVRNLSATVDRLSQILSATIEPHQSIVGVRGIRRGDDDEGCIVVRAPPSLRAPHRFTRDRECYVRRGRESVPMPMDEIQNLAVSVNARRRDRFEALDRDFDLFRTGHMGVHPVPSHAFHIRTAYLPDLEEHINLDRNVLQAMTGGSPLFQVEGNKTRNDVAFRGLGYNWKPQLRGKYCDSFERFDGGISGCRKAIKRSLLMSTEFTESGRRDERSGRQYVHLEWLIGYLGDTITSFQEVAQKFPSHRTGVLRCSISVGGDFDLRFGRSVWSNASPFPQGITEIPDFEVSDLEDFGSAFTTLVDDLCGIAGFDFPLTTLVPDQ